jgi:hypothetical protein
MPLPPVSSRSFRCCGRYANLTGPKSVECSPIRKTHASRTTGSLRKKPNAASAMIAISSDLTKRIRRALSYLSASWPLVAEKSRNGRMKSAPITSPASAGGSQLTCSW